MNHNKIWDQFTNQYSLSKTLRFELKPVGETEKHIKAGGENAIIANVEGTLIGKDAKLANNYKVVKKLLDEMHRVFLNEVLQGGISSKYFKSESITTLYDFNKSIVKIKETIKRKRREGSDTKEEEAQLKKEQIDVNKVFEAIIKSLEKLFNDHKVSALLDGKTALKTLNTYIEEGKILFPLTLKVDGKEKELNKEQAIGYANLFIEEKFTSYFSGFNENRANVYNTKGEGQNDFWHLLSTSVASRLFVENLKFHFDNINRWETISKSIEFYKGNSNVLEVFNKTKEIEKAYNCSLKEIFAPAYFLECLSQDGIDRYNKILGGEPAKEGVVKKQGVNEIINLTKQQTPEKDNRRFPKLQIFYKQILSTSDSIFIESFTDDTELLSAVKLYGERITQKKEATVSLLDHLKEDIIADLDKASEVNYDGYFLDRESVRKISTDICNSWDTIDTVWIKQIEQEPLTKTQKEKLVKQKLFSYQELKDIFEYIQTSTLNDDDSTNGFKKKWKTIKPDEILPTYIKETIEYLITKASNQNNKKNDDGEVLLDKNGKPIVETNSIVKAWKQLEHSGILEPRDVSKNSSEPKIQFSKEKEVKAQEIEQIKFFLDASLQLAMFLRSFTIREKDLSSEQSIDNAKDWYTVLHSFNATADIVSLYNKVRNYVAKKPYSLDKIKLNFANATLGNGWDVNKETDNTSLLFIKDNQYYLGILNSNIKDNNKMFDYVPDFDDLLNTNSKKNETKNILKSKILVTEEKPHYKKMVYKLLPGASKMLPKVFFSNNRIQYFNPSSKIIEIRNHGSHTKNGSAQDGFDKKEFSLSDCHAMIDFFKSSLEKHLEWKQFNFKFSPTTSYQSIDEFYREVEAQGYKLNFDTIEANYIDTAVKEGKLFLFKIWNKDFSEYSNGKPNLHTEYWRLLFHPENLKDVVLKLNGEAELFFRPTSIYKNGKVEHPANQAIDNKNINAKKSQSIFKYDLIKDKRFTQDKYFFHIPISLNFKANEGGLNKKILHCLKDNKEVNIIGIDRGERHLLYYTVINQKGVILEQGSFNSITSKIKNSSNTITFDYQEALDTKEKERDKARKSWDTIENIKELKEGYLSQVVHKLSQLIIQHNAIVVLEDLNMGFKRGRFKVEKQVYQKFERALIEKLNYLVDKNKIFGEAGHYLNAYQLTAPFESFQKLGKQSGILFYTTASYTSKTDPISGFIKDRNISYSNVPDSQTFWKNTFTNIVYNKVENRFEFTYKLGVDFDEESSKSKIPLKKESWVICSNVTRSFYKSKEKKYEVYEDMTQNFMKLFENHSINYKDGNFLKALVDSTTIDLHRSAMFYFNLLLNMRVTYKDNEIEYDFIQSPVAPFFNSQELDSGTEEEKSKALLPINSDANGAYNIARKGILILEQINTSKDIEKIKLEPIDKITWQNYVQRDEMVNQQKSYLKNK